MLQTYTIICYNLYNYMLHLIKTTQYRGEKKITVFIFHMHPQFTFTFSLTKLPRSSRILKYIYNIVKYLYTDDDELISVPCDKRLLMK